MARILHVEDCASHRAIVDGILRGLCTVVSVQTLGEARELLIREGFDLILLDVELPDGDGYAFCSGFRALYGRKCAPVVFMTGKSSEEEVLQGLMAGGTDYIIKPFEPSLFRERIEDRLRSMKPVHDSNGGEQFFSGNLRFDLIKKEVHVDTPQGYRDLMLTPAEFRLLHCLARHPGERMGREQILLEIWGTRSVLMSDRTIEAILCQLRKKMPEGPCHIETLFDLGGYQYSDGAPGKEQ